MAEETKKTEETEELTEAEESEEHILQDWKKKFAKLYSHASIAEGQAVAGIDYLGHWLDSFRDKAGCDLTAVDNAYKKARKGIADTVENLYGFGEDVETFLEIQDANNKINKFNRERGGRYAFYERIRAFARLYLIGGLTEGLHDFASFVFMERTACETYGKDYWLYYALLSRIYQENGKGTDSDAMYKESLRLNAQGTFLFRMLSDLRFGQYRDALEEFASLSQIMPDNISRIWIRFAGIFRMLASEGKISSERLDGIMSDSLLKIQSLLHKFDASIRKKTEQEIEKMKTGELPQYEKLPQICAQYGEMYAAIAQAEKNKAFLRFCITRSSRLIDEQEILASVKETAESVISAKDLEETIELQYRDYYLEHIYPYQNEIARRKKALERELDYDAKSIIGIVGNAIIKGFLPDSPDHAVSMGILSDSVAKEYEAFRKEYRKIFPEQVDLDVEGQKYCLRTDEPIPKDVISERAERRFSRKYSLLRDPLFWVSMVVLLGLVCATSVSVALLIAKVHWVRLLLLIGSVLCLGAASICTWLHIRNRKKRHTEDLTRFLQKSDAIVAELEDMIAYYKQIDSTGDEILAVIRESKKAVGGKV